MSILEKWQQYVRPELNEYSRTSEWQSAQVINMELMTEIPSTCHNILDLGCGDGWTTNHFRTLGKEATGVTVNAAEASHAKKKYGLDLVICDMHDMPFGDSTFDCIYNRECYEHSVAPFIAMCEMNRVLQLGGYVLLNIPWEDWIREDSHYSVLTPSQMREMFYKGRFIVLKEGRSSSNHFWYLARKVADIGGVMIFPPPLPNKQWLNGKVIS